MLILRLQMTHSSQFQTWANSFSVCYWGNLNPSLHHTVKVFEVVVFQGTQSVSGQRALGVLCYSSAPRLQKRLQSPRLLARKCGSN